MRLVRVPRRCHDRESPIPLAHLRRHGEQRSTRRCPARVTMPAEAPYADLLRRLALNDARTVDALLAGSIEPAEIPDLGEKTCALARIAALIATESASASYQWAVAVALSAGAEERDVVGVLLSVAPIVGVARVASAALALAVALGVELDVLGEA